MVFLPLAISSASRYLYHGSFLGQALLFGFLTFGSHVVAAVILIVCTGFFALTSCLHGRRISKRPFVLLGLLLLVTAHQWIFVLADSHFVNKSALEPSWKYDGRGLGYLSDLFWNGGLFDCARFPALTLLLLVSIPYGVLYRKAIRSAPGGDLLAYATPLSLIFFTLCAGRELWGWFFDLVPVLKSLHVHRFAIGVHLFGVLAIAASAGAGIRLLSATKPRQVLAIFALLLLLRPAFQERAKMYVETFNRHEQSARLISSEPELMALLAAAETLPYGWTYIGSKSSWQRDLVAAGYIPLDLFTVMRGVPTVGGILFHAFSLAGETLFEFDPRNAWHFDLFGIRNVVAPSSWAGFQGFTRSGVFGRYAIWSRESHMLGVGDERFAERANYSGQTELMRTFVRSFRASVKPAGVLRDQKMEFPWRFEGTAVMENAGKGYGAVGFHPNWRVSVDGEPGETKWTVPGFVQVDVPAGTHKIVFHYKGSALKPYLLTFSLLLIGFIIFFCRPQRA